MNCENIYSIIHDNDHKHLSHSSKLQFVADSTYAHNILWFERVNETLKKQ